MRDFRLYMLVGGMPQAVHEYIRSNSFKMVDSVKREIIELYEDDFSKIDPSGRAASLFDAIPHNLPATPSVIRSVLCCRAPRQTALKKLSRT